MPGIGYNNLMTLRMPLIALVASLFLLLSPLVSSAQTQPADELHATIMAQLLRDPRTANIPPEQLKLLVDALASQAQSQEVTVTDLRWQPPASTIGGELSQDETSIGADCAGGFSALCVMSEGFGFVGPDITIPLFFLVISGLLILILARMKRYFHMIHPSAAAPVAQPAPAQPGQGMYV